MQTDKHRREHDRDPPGRLMHQITLLEIILWVSGISAALAVPHWIGQKSLLVIFYGTLGLITWRLAKVMSAGCAIALAFVAAVLFTAIVIPLIS